MTGLIRTHFEAMPDPTSLMINIAPQLSAALKVLDETLPLAMEVSTLASQAIKTGLAAADINTGLGASGIKTGLAAAGINFDLPDLPQLFQDARYAAYEAAVASSPSYRVPTVDLENLRAIQDLRQELDDVKAELRMISPLKKPEVLN